MKRQSYLPGFKSALVRHGGDVNHGKRKSARPFSPRLPVHVVLRSSKARGTLSLLTAKNSERVETLLRANARRYRIRVYRYANVGNHLHILLKTDARNFNSARRDLSSFLRRFAGELAFQITGARKGAAFGKFWDGLVFTRLVQWGRAFERARDYVTKNMFEGAGLWNRKRHPDWELITF